MYSALLNIHEFEQQDDKQGSAGCASEDCRFNDCSSGY